MGCLVMLILAFIFRGAIIGAIGLVLALLAMLLSLGIWGIIIVIALGLIVAAFA